MNRTANPRGKSAATPIGSLILFSFCLIFGSLSGGCQEPQGRRDLPLPTVKPVRQTYSKGTEEGRPREFPNSPTEPVKPIGERIIIVDAGHGGKDPGTLGGKGMTKYPEKTIVLKIATLLSNALQQEGFRVIMTRSDDRFIELENRAAYADHYNADLLISIHCNANRRRDVSGATVYISRSALSRSERVANVLCSRISNVIPCTGVGRGNYKVLVNHSRPAVLVECGYLTNPSDAKRLNQSSFQEDLANAMAEAIRDAFSR